MAQQNVQTRLPVWIFNFWKTNKTFKRYLYCLPNARLSTMSLLKLQEAPPVLCIYYLLRDRHWILLGKQLFLHLVLYLFIESNLIMHHFLFFSVFVLTSHTYLFTEVFKGKINWKKSKTILGKVSGKIDFFFVLFVLLLLLLIIYRSDTLPAAS